MAEKNIQIVAVRCVAHCRDVVIRYIDGEPDAINCGYFRPDYKIQCSHFQYSCPYLSPFVRAKELEEMVGGVTKKD